MQLEAEKIAQEIRNLKNAVGNLRRYSENLPALDRNLQRIAASIKMLELNFIDPHTFVKSR
jgi:hypothetical protein